MTKLLLNAGADPNIQDNKERTPLHHAAQFDCVESIEMLLNAGADQNIKDKEGKIPLHYATEFKCFGSIETLLNAGANPDMKGNDSKTPLQMAADCHYLIAVGAFLDNKQQKLPDELKELDKRLIMVKLQL